MDHHTDANWTDRELDLLALLSTEEQAETEVRNLEAIRLWIAQAN